MAIGGNAEDIPREGCVSLTGGGQDVLVVGGRGGGVGRIH